MICICENFFDLTYRKTSQWTIYKIHRNQPNKKFGKLQFNNGIYIQIQNKILWKKKKKNMGETFAKSLCTFASLQLTQVSFL